MVNGEGSVTCIVQATGGAISCTNTTTFLQRGLILGVFTAIKNPAEKPHDFFAWGIAPDWAKKVLLKVGDMIQPVAVRHNGYALHAHVPIILDKLVR